MADSLLQTAWPALSSLLAFLVAIIVLVSVHEWGHFYAARALGVKVLRFSIGFGKPLLNWYDRSGTEYVVAGIPLGGYVKMLDEREGDVPSELLSVSFGRQPVWKRSVIVAAGPIINLVFAFVVYWVLFLGGETGLVPEVGAVLPQSQAEQAGLRVGHEIVAVDGRDTPIQKAVIAALLSRMGDTGELRLTVRRPHDTAEQTIVVSLNQWLSDATEPDLLGSLGAEFYHAPFVRLGEVMPGSVAERAGLKAGDVIERADGAVVSGPDEWVQYVRARPEQTIQLGIRRERQWLEVEVIPARVEGNVGQIGVQVGYTPPPPTAFRHLDLGFFQAIPRAAGETVDQTVLLLQAIKKLVMGHLSPKNLSGPLGIAKVAGVSASLGFEAFCQMLAVLSISLGVMNLLPIPMLDGGHLMLFLAEACRGKPLSEKVQLWGSQIGMLLLAGLMLFAIYNDILKFR